MSTGKYIVFFTVNRVAIITDTSRPNCYGLCSGQRKQHAVGCKRLAAVLRQNIFPLSLVPSFDTRKNCLWLEHFEDGLLPAADNCCVSELFEVNLKY